MAAARLGYPAAEAAQLLDVTVNSLNGALKRARAALTDQTTPPAEDPDPELLERFVAAFTTEAVDDLVALMTDDIWVRMPPLPFEYHGPTAAAGFFASVAPHRRTIERMVPVVSPPGASTSATASPETSTSSACS
jgi:RNA polymerase sigma-70 factor (ECF subfamily)